MLSSAGTPFWKLVLKQFDDLLVKVRHYSIVQWQQLIDIVISFHDTLFLQILIVAAAVDFGIALVNGESGAK